MEQLRQIKSYKKMFKATDMEYDEFNRWLQDLGLLHSQRICESCNVPMQQRNPKGNRREGPWRCRSRGCGDRDKEVGFYVDTFFENSKITPLEVFQLSFCWVNNRLTHENIREELRRDDGSTIGKQTLVDWSQFFRDICCEWFIQNPQMIGGPNVVVEIDETYVYKRKYNRGRLPENRKV
jgi:hypothetical protein